MSQQIALFSQPDTDSQLLVPPEQQPLLAAGGGGYIADFITPAEEQDLLQAVDNESWITDLRRRVQHYGYRYDYSKRKLSEDDRLGDLPVWSEFVVRKLVKEGIFTTPPEQMIVNEYEAGQGIAPHTDSPCFGGVLASLSLASDCKMRVFPDKNTEAGKFDIVLKARSLVIYTGVSRYDWRHAILPKKSDTQDGQKIPRQRRVSLTFRTIA